MRIGLLLCAGILCLSLVPLGAQAHGDGYFVVGASGNAHYVAPGGAVNSLQFGTSSLYSCLMHADNETALVFDYTKNSILKVDPKTLAIVGTFFTSSLLASYSNVYDMCFDQNGDLFFGSSNSSGIGRGVFKIDQSSMMTPVTVSLSSSNPFYYPENLEIDIDSAELLVADDRTGDPLVILQRDGSSFTTVASGWNFRYGTHKDMNTGVIYSGTCCNSSTPNRTLYYLPPASTTPGPWLASATFPGGYDPMIDRASMANPRIVCAAWNSSGAGGLWHVDINTKAISQVTTIAYNTYDVAFVYGRNLQTVKTGKGTWDVHMDVPSEAGKTYMMALSINGTRPGVGLPDGRRIPLAFDLLSYVSITTGLAPYFTGNIGSLDPNGEAKAKINVRSLPAAANGVLVWIGAIVLDPKAPVGISVVVDTKVLKIEGL